MSFSLLQPEFLYKKVVTPTEAGNWQDGVYYKGSDPVVTYEEFEGFWEDIGSGSKTFALPEGLRSSRSIYIFSGLPLNISSDLGGTNFREGDVIYLSDPETDVDSLPYDIWNLEDWSRQKGFTLLDEHFVYIAVRREKR